MKETNKTLVLKLLEQDALNNGYGLTTEYVAENLYMQRSNASKLLNELVEEGYVNKTEGVRPVVYSRSSKNFDRSSYDAFKDVVGNDGSLKQAVNLAKAAIIYPNKSLYTLLVGDVGSGKKMFSRCMYQYALNMGALNKDGEYRYMNCSLYEGDSDRLKEDFDKILTDSEEGFLYISEFDKMDTGCKRTLLSILENGYFEKDGNRCNEKTIIVCSIENENKADSFDKKIIEKLPVKIELPPLEKRGMKERFELIEVFFNQQAAKSKNMITLNSEVMMALLLYRCGNSIKQLQNDIGLVCASAYARQMKTKDKTIRVLITDLPQNIRNGILNYKSRKKEVDMILEKDHRFTFTSDDVSIARVGKGKAKRSIYTWIDEKSSELRKDGLSDEEIDSIENLGIKEEFQKYSRNLGNSISDRNQLAQIVDSFISESVHDLIDKASKLLNRVYPVSIYYGLCLHMQSILENRERNVDLNIDDVTDFVKRNRQEYNLAEELARLFKNHYGLHLSKSETILIAMFLLSREDASPLDDKPAVLIAMHGNGIAREMAQVAYDLSGVEVYHYDMSLSKQPLDALEEIKQLLNMMPVKKGVVVLYDQGSFKDIFNMIMLETGLQIETMEIPLSSFLFDFARKSQTNTDALSLRQSIASSYSEWDIFAKEEKNLSKAIITFCLTGEGGAVQLKNYLEKNFVLNNIEVIAVQLKEQNEFLSMINRIRREKQILCMIGTFKPNIYGIPFIPIEKVFSSNNDLDQLLSDKEKSDAQFKEDVDIVFDSLKEELENINIFNLKEEELHFIEEVESESGIQLDDDQKLGLIIHMLCAMSRLADGRGLAINPNRDIIIRANTNLYRVIEKAAIPLERKASVKFDDNEIAYIITQIKKSSLG